MLMIWPSLMNVGPSRFKSSTATCNHTTNLLRIQCRSPDAHDLAQLDECGAQPLHLSNCVTAHCTKEQQTPKQTRDRRHSPNAHDLAQLDECRAQPLQVVACVTTNCNTIAGCN
jgi:hypothetical protein